MSDNTLTQLEQLEQLKQLIDQIFEKNSQLKNKVTELEQQKATLIDENEMLQLEALDAEEKQKQTGDILTNLLTKLQNVEDIN